MAIDLEARVAQAGDDVYIGSMLVRLHLWGMVSDLDTPAMMSGSLEVLGDEASLVLDALVGPRGPAGQNAPIVRMQWDSHVKTPEALPKTYLNEAIDIGKAFWIGNQCFVWTGDGSGVGPGRWQIRAMGTAGPAGPVPRITPSVEVLPWNSREDDEIVVTGTTTHPSWLHRLKLPRGPAGPSAAIVNAEDYEQSARPDNFEPMDVGKVLTVIPGDLPDQYLWGARRFIDRHVKMYTVPEGAFEPYLGLTQRHRILTYEVEPQPYDWVPFISGHIKAAGLELSTTPLQVGVEVRLGNAATGTLVGRGHGTAVGWQTLSSHYSTPADPNVATSPANQIGVVPAGQVGTLNVSLFNDGLLGAYIFTRNGAQLVILAIPVEDVIAA